MPSLGKPEVRDVSVESTELPDAKLPQDNDELFEQIRNDPDVQTPDMEVQGDWTFGAIADRISMEERVNNNEVNWNSFKQVNWAGYEDDSASNLLQGGSGRPKEFSSPDGVPINELASPGTPQPFLSFGQPAAAPTSGFATGDPGLGTPGTKNYKMDGRAGNSSAVTRNGNVLVTASEGERAVAFSPAGDAEFIQMINQQDWGHQARAVMEALTGMAGLGTDSEIRAPSFSTANGPVSFMTPFTYSFSRLTGVAVMQPSFDIKAESGTTMTFALRQPDGTELTSADVEVSEGSQTVAVNFLNAPANGIVSLSAADGTAYTVAGTEKFPPL